MAWKATIRYEARDRTGLEHMMEEVIEGETVDCQLWQADQDIMWIGGGKKTVLVPMRRLVCVIKEQE